MAETKPKERPYKVYLEGKDGNRTMEIVAASPEKAKRIALRSAEDIAEAQSRDLGEEVAPYEVVSCEAV